MHLNDPKIENSCVWIQVHHDMNAPLAHYFLFTGHNSYLTGNQISSDSSVHPIINALLQGVRVIELDLWPNSKKNGVEVRHGGYEFNLWLLSNSIMNMVLVGKLLILSPR